MANDRRQFVQQMAVGAAALAGLTAIPTHIAGALGVAPGLPPAEGWDVAWLDRLAGKRRAVFDIAETENAYGVWRSQFWGMQLQEVFKLAPREISTVVVLRHNGVLLALDQEFWRRYGKGKAWAGHPVTQQPSDLNPALLASSRGEIDAKYDALALDQAIGRGTVALACNLALEAIVVPAVAKADGVSAEEARRRARGHLVPGVILQPSGVFATLSAQDAGCRYVRAS